MKPERWSVHVGADDVATLDIPAELRRDRRFEIDCRFVVHLPPGTGAAWHAMHVHVDGSLEWSRRIATHNAGDTDSLDVHFRRDLPAGRALRIVATTTTHRVLRVSLAIEAEEA